MLVTTPAIVISALKYGEADLIAKCYTRSDGLKSYLLRRILKSKKGNLRTAMFQPAMQLEIVANHKNKGTLESIREAKVLHPYQSLHTDITKTSIVLFLSEIIRSSVMEEEENLPLYHFLEHAFLWLDHQERAANFHLLFLLELTKYLGFYPDSSHMDKEQFNLQTGQFEAHPDVYSISPANLSLLKELLKTKFDTLHTLKLNQQSRAAFMDMLLDYYHLHIQGFKKPKSLSVLTNLFN
ncbi:DNA repair protein RecO [Flavimarina sp. Hel_I_48]|uniref:DNA repair protein RecO n=1 Tax=Flavimarina sp. Hel_I_48 TaxID=1392488 RepID=UPI0004DF6A3B|nr:DNA repair protein RecO [Flavimarina sp. Hel_I_48]